MQQTQQTDTNEDPSVTQIPNSAPFDGLTAREREVAQQLCFGHKNREIAEALGISIKTVDTHRGHILRKLGVRNNVELVRLAIRNGWHTIEVV